MSTRTLKEYIFILVKGLAMGAADVVPGVSGGTIAFITGIYDELLHSLKKVGPEALKVLFKEGFFKAWHFVNGNFLLAVFGGVLISIKTFASIISFCLDNYPLLVWGFFSGLILASIVLLVRHQDGWRWQDSILCFLGAAVVVFISLAKPSQLPGEWWILFFGGFVAICAMILPGISGSFILLLVGLYPVFIEAVKTVDVIALLSFGGGCVAGLMVFSRVLSWLLDRYYRETIAVLIGFLVGSLNVTWPWKEVVTSVTNRHGEVIPLVQKNVSPFYFGQNIADNNQLLGVVLLAVGGMVLVLCTEFISSKFKKNEEK